VLTSSSKVMVDQKAGNSLLYLPLDKLIQSTGQPLPDALAAGNVEQPAVTTPASEAAGLTRGVRDTLRGRDRETR
jgi:membrane protease subunit HflK